MTISLYSQVELTLEMYCCRGHDELQKQLFWISCVENRERQLGVLWWHIVSWEVASGENNETSKEKSSLRACLASIKASPRLPRAGNSWRVWPMAYWLKVRCLLKINMEWVSTNQEERGGTFQTLRIWGKVLLESSWRLHLRFGSHVGLT